MELHCVHRNSFCALFALLKLVVKNLLVIGWKKSTLKKLFHVPPCHHRWFALAPPCDLQLVLPCRHSSFELVRHELDMLFLGDVSHIKEFLYFIDPVQEGLDVKVPNERRSLDLHLYSLGLSFLFSYMG